MSCRTDDGYAPTITDPGALTRMEDGTADANDPLSLDQTETTIFDEDGIGESVDSVIPGYFDEAFFYEIDWSLMEMV